MAQCQAQEGKGTKDRGREMSALKVTVEPVKRMTGKDSVWTKQADWTKET